MGRGKGVGTGYPLTFRCTECKKGDWRRSSRGTNYEVITQVESEKHGQLVRQDRQFKYFYKCLDCGHTGWTRHTDAAQVWKREGGGIDVTADIARVGGAAARKGTL